MKTVAIHPRTSSPKDSPENIVAPAVVLASMTETLVLY